MSEKEIVLSAKNVSEIAKKLYGNVGGNSFNKAKALCVKYGKAFEIIRKPKLEKCLCCGKKLRRGQYKFCSSSCSNTYNNSFRTQSEETKLKISNSLKKFYEGKIKENKIVLLKTKEKPVKEKIKAYCVVCNKELDKWQTKFCSPTCNAFKRHVESYEHYIHNQKEYCRPNWSAKNFKKEFLNDQNDKCAVCGCGTSHNGRELVFVLDHIDGDASNNMRDNLRLVCPNCDSQLDTFKSKNKFSTRRNYWKEKIKNELNQN